MADLSPAAVTLLLVIYLFLSHVPFATQEKVGFQDNPNVREENVAVTDDTSCPEPRYCRCGPGRFVLCEKNISYIPKVPTDTADLIMSYGYLPNINELTFANITCLTLARLKLQNCGVRRLSADAFRNVTFRKGILSLSYNNIPVNDLQQVICQLSNSDMRTLVLDGMSLTNISSWLFDCLSNTSITALYLKHNGVERLSGNVFSALSKLTYLELGNNALVSNFVETIHFPFLKYLGLSYNQLVKIPTFVDALGVTLCPRLETLDLIGNAWLTDLGSTDFKGLASLIELNLASCGITRLHANFLTEMPKLENIFLQQNGIQFIATYAFNSTSLKTIRLTSNNLVFSEISNYEMFKECPNLVRLDLDDNSLSFVTGSQFTELFSPLKKLIVLRMEKTLRGEVPDNMLDSLPSLKALYLGSNLINHWNSSVFAGAKNLRRLVLARNQIASINKASMDSLHRLRVLDLRGNPFACTCDLLWFRNWIKQTKVFMFGVEGYLCNYPQEWKDKPLLQFNPTADECTPLNLAVILGASLGSLAAIIIVAIVVIIKYRMHIRYFYFLIRARMKQYERPVDDNEYRHDAFVVYSSDDRDWVINELLPLVEEQEGYKLCVFDRDFTPGRDILDSIMDNLEVSRKVIVVLSDNFAMSEWCKWELTMAQNKLLDERKDILILVKLDEIKRENLNHRLMLLMRNTVYIDWNDCNLGREMFWQRLVSALAKPMAQMNV